jgi:two-component system nitrate/nitrite response regulator NarL
MKILIADDNIKIRDMMKTILINSAEEIWECDNGLDAFSIYKEQHPDCVLMDIEMSPLDGIKTTLLIKRENPNARIVIVTQHDNEEIREKAKKAGADNFLSKENLIDLRKVIDDVMGV